jgi:hypothetical protein
MVLVAVGKFWAATGCDAQGTGCKVGGCPSGQWYAFKTASKDDC